MPIEVYPEVAYPVVVTGARTEVGPPTYVVVVVVGTPAYVDVVPL
jgi:hypothetical protein